MRGGFPRGRGPVRGRGRGYGPRGGPHMHMPMNKGMERPEMNYQQMMQALNSNFNEETKL